MNKDFVKGILFGLGMLLVFSIVGAVSAIGFHFADEILPGNFTGNYNFLNGEIGIGTTTPEKILHINGTNPAIRIEEDSIGIWDIAIDNAPNSLQVRNQIAGTVPLYISSNDNIGIGISAPSERLDVNGKIRMRSQTLASDSDDIVATKKYVDNKVSSSVPTLQAGWYNSCPAGWVDTGLSDCDANDGPAVQEDSCTGGGGTVKLCLRII